MLAHLKNRDFGIGWLPLLLLVWNTYYPLPGHFQISGRDGSGNWKKDRVGSGTGIPSDPARYHIHCKPLILLLLQLLLLQLLLLLGHSVPSLLLGDLLPQHHIHCRPILNERGLCQKKLQKMSQKDQVKKIMVSNFLQLRIALWDKAIFKAQQNNSEEEHWAPCTNNEAYNSPLARVAECQSFYTEQNLHTKFYTKKSV